MSNIVLAVHGGAGTPKAPLDEPSFHRGVAAALRAGHAILAGGGSAIDAVQSAVLALEGDAIFNAGRGAVLNEAGDVEHDAALMCGRSAVAGSNPGSERR